MLFGMQNCLPRLSQTGKVIMLLSIPYKVMPIVSLMALGTLITISVTNSLKEQ